VSMFKTAAVFGDIHFGDRSDSPVHNQDCMNYIEWFCEQASAAQADRIIFVGDWFDNQSRLRLDTNHFGAMALRRLLEVAPVEMLVGNHDMFYKHSREVHSLVAYEEWKNVRVHNRCAVIDGVGLVPFLVGTEYLEVLQMEAKYLFGHFELPRFLTNATIAFRDNGQFNSEQFLAPEMVFSGHFHKRQMKTNKAKVPVWYIGNPFGHDFNDVGDTERGMMILKWGELPEFIDWTEGPLYQRFVASDVVTMLETDSLKENTRPSSVLEIHDDVGLELEDVNLIRQELSLLVRETRLVPKNTSPGMDMDVVADDLGSRSLTDVVVEKLEQIDPRGSDINPATLVRLFKGE
jgi:predicted phosphodiesterase